MCYPPDTDHDMNDNTHLSSERQTYNAPKVYVAVFYLLLIVWTGFSVALLGLKDWTNWSQIFMIGFVFVFTWYFSLGISYRMDLAKDGSIQLTSLRRIIKADPRKMELIEGPHLPIGFVRFKLEREKAYLFCIIKNRQLKRILFDIRSWNPDIKFRNIHK